MINLKNKSAVILSPEAGVKISGASVEPVVNDRVKTKRYSAKRDLYGDFAYAQPLKMTILSFLLSLNLSTSWAGWCECNWSGTTLTIRGCDDGIFTRCLDGSNQNNANNVIIDTDYVTSIGDSAFAGASSLTSITIPEGVTSIGSGAFQRASSLKSITIPDSVTDIGYGAFNSASRLKSITIPDSVTSIGESAFAGARGLNNIMCKGDETSCAATVAQIRNAGYTGTISYPTDKTSCEGASTSLYVWDGSKCGRRNEEQCNSVAKYYYNTTNNQCQLLPETESACTGANIEWTTDNKCVNKNYTPPQEANNSDTGGDDVGDISGDFNPADCYNKGQVPYENKCWDEYPFARKRWTPAEAAEWLHDGNDNFVVITFKK